MHNVHLAGQDKPLKLIVLPFEARYHHIVDDRPSPFTWCGPNARLAMALLHWDLEQSQLSWPFRMSIYKLVGVSMRIGDEDHPAGEYPPNTPNPAYKGPLERKPGDIPQRPMLSLFIPPYQDVKIKNISAGSEIHGEIFIEPLVLSENKREGVLVEVDANEWIGAGQK